jgi:hypothetical protein
MGKSNDILKSCMKYSCKKICKPLLLTSVPGVTYNKEKGEYECDLGASNCVVLALLNHKTYEDVLKLQKNIEWLSEEMR